MGDLFGSFPRCARVRPKCVRKKFLVSSFNDYKFVDSRPIMDQFHEMQRIQSNIKHHNINMDEVCCVKYN